MKSLIFGGVAALAIAPAVEAAQPCGTSYMILPNGKCVNLTYTTILGSSRSNAANTNAAYQRQFQANVTIQVAEYYQRTETEKEKEARLKDLAESGKVVDSVNSKTQQVEDLLYPLHRRAMGEVERGFSRRRAVVSRQERLEVARWSR